MHQREVMVTINEEEQSISRADDDEFHCPIGDCGYKTPNARYVQDHLSTCKGLGQTNRGRAPTGGDAVLIPIVMSPISYGYVVQIQLGMEFTM
ncbi:hypothetical protein DFH28DRAFT_1140398 [Melampsora americana]|nr:hypothetical protein DFH28DRAFT_1140398 [Melampsora americana]